MDTDLFDFALSRDQIALRPLSPRDSARLLVVREGATFEHRHVRDLPNLLRAGDILSINDSKVIPARLVAMRPARTLSGSDVTIEVTLHKRDTANRYRAFAQPARRLRLADQLKFGSGLEAEVLQRDGGEVTLLFNCSGADLDREVAARGNMPLPPYIASRRAPDARDLSDYQTVYAVKSGSVAAPTAGLHLTTELLDRLVQARIEIARTTLHVGAGTFLPVSAADTDGHKMHAEHAVVTLETAQRLNQARVGGGRIVAVGTTALRTLESAATLDGVIHPFDAETDIFITPGYRFRAVDVLLTNFHLPRSTLFMLVCAFISPEVMRAAYAEAIAKDYRFYSYGDACLLVRPG